MQRGKVTKALDKQGTLGRLERLRQGEEFETLVAEYEGVPVSTAEDAVEMAAVAEMVAAVEAEIEEEE